MFDRSNSDKPVHVKMENPVKSERLLMEPEPTPMQPPVATPTSNITSSVLQTSSTTIAKISGLMSTTEATTLEMKDTTISKININESSTMQTYE